MRRSTRTVSALLTAVTVVLPLCLPCTAHAAPKRARRGSVAMRSVPLPDGSGTMRLPAGWQITGAHQGMVSAAGSQGMVDLGIWVPVYTPEAAAQLWTRPPMVAPYGDAAQAVRQIVPQLAAVTGQSGFRWIRLIDRAPAAAPQGKGEFLHYEWEFPGKGRLQTVALVLMMPNVDGSWIYYSSGITAPSKSFARSLPVLKQIWASWKVSDHVYKQRLDNALASMRETGRILREANDNRQDAQDRSNRAWSHTIRGTWVYEDTESGRRYEASHDDMNRRLEQMNRAAGYERYRQIPYERLNRP